jgi:hypothetical protein
VDWGKKELEGIPVVGFKILVDQYQWMILMNPYRGGLDYAMLQTVGVTFCATVLFHSIHRSRVTLKIFDPGNNFFLDLMGFSGECRKSRD